MARPKKVEEKQLAPAVPQPVPIAAPQQPQQQPQQPNLAGTNLQGRVIDVDNFIKVRNSVSATTTPTTLISPPAARIAMPMPLPAPAHHQHHHHQYSSPLALPFFFTRFGTKLPWVPLRPPQSFSISEPAWSITACPACFWSSTQARSVPPGFLTELPKTQWTSHHTKNAHLVPPLIHRPIHIQFPMHPRNPVLFHVISSNLSSAFASTTTSTSSHPGCIVYIGVSRHVIGARRVGRHDATLLSNS